MLFHNFSNLPLIFSLFSTSTVLLYTSSHYSQKPSAFLREFGSLHSLAAIPPNEFCSLAISMFMSALLLTLFPLPSLTCWRGWSNKGFNFEVSHDKVMTLSW